MGKKVTGIAKTILTSSQFKRFLWNTLNGAVAVGITVLGELDLAYSAVIFAVLNGITKEVNKKLSK